MQREKRAAPENYKGCQAIVVKTNLLSETILPLSAVTDGFNQALRAAAETLGATAPNPSVGCTLLDREGKVLAVGAHPKAGAPHAEVIALDAARSAGLYDQVYAALVTLEPCAHHGRTPPCAQTLKESPLQEVWIGLRDPNPQAMGGGALLHQSKNAKKVFFLEDLEKKNHDWATLLHECRALALPFLTRIKEKRPWITVKQALNKEGSMIPPAGQTTFTSLSSLKQAHQLRRASDAIITGIGTVIADHPSFSVRYVKDHADRAPRLLIVMDRHDRLPSEWKRERERDHFIIKTCRNFKDAEILMYEMGINWAMVEAGPTLLKSISDENFWDEWWIIQQKSDGKDDQTTLKMRDNHKKNESPLQFLGSIGRN